MPHLSDAVTPPNSDEARSLLTSLQDVELERFAIVGSCLRFDERSRNHLRVFRQRLAESFFSRSTAPRNFLLWGTPGSGKSYLMQQIARSLPPEVRYLELNLAQLTQASLRSGLEDFAATPGPGLCFIDECDALPDQAWPYEVLLPYLEPPVPPPHPMAYVLAGSGGADLDELTQRIRSRPKGTDLLSRIPRGNEFVVGTLGPGDKILVSIVQLLLAAKEEGHTVKEIEKLALYYLAVHPAFTSARQLRSRAAQCAQRIPPAEETIRYDYLFRAGDPENKRFWTETESVRNGLEDVFVRVSPSLLLPGGPALATDARAARRASALEGPSYPRLAVLPLANISPDSKDEYFADGLTDELIGVISRIPGLSVISRTSVMRYKGATKQIGEIGRELSVATVLEGSVRKDGNRVRVSAQLVDVAGDRTLWSEQFDRELRDVFAIQEEVSQQVARALKPRLIPSPGGGSGVHGTSNTEAYTLYLRGRYFWNRGTKDWLLKALEEFERAAKLDPTYGPAHAGVADSLLLLGRRGDVAPGDAYPRAVESALHALKLDPDLAEPHTALGAIRQEYEWKWAESEREFKQALELNPSYSTAHSWYALYLGHVGRFAEALAESAQAAELDPLSHRIYTGAAEEFIFARQYDDAIRAAQRALEVEPSFGPAHAFIAEALVEQGTPDLAIREFEEAGRLLGAQAWMGRLGHAQALLGRQEEAIRIIDQLKVNFAPATPGNPFLSPSPYASLDIGLVHLGLGESEAALDWFERARDDRVPEVVHFKCEPIYDPVRKEPRFRAILRSIGMES